MHKNANPKRSSRLAAKEEVREHAALAGETRKRGRPALHEQDDVLRQPQSAGSSSARKNSPARQALTAACALNNAHASTQPTLPSSAASDSTSGAASAQTPADRESSRKHLLGDASSHASSPRTSMGSVMAAAQARKEASFNALNMPKPTNTVKKVTPSKGATSGGLHDASNMKKQSGPSLTIHEPPVYQDQPDAKRPQAANAAAGAIGLAGGPAGAGNGIGGKAGNINGGMGMLRTKLESGGKVSPARGGAMSMELEQGFKLAVERWMSSRAALPKSDGGKFQSEIKRLVSRIFFESFEQERERHADGGPAGRQELSGWETTRTRFSFIGDGQEASSSSMEFLSTRHFFSGSILGQDEQFRQLLWKVEFELTGAFYLSFHTQSLQCCEDVEWIFLENLKQLLRTDISIAELGVLIMLAGNAKKGGMAWKDVEELCFWTDGFSMPEFRVL
eukprot:767651-Hanusia_phi.AAC.3